MFPGSCQGDKCHNVGKGLQSDECSWFGVWNFKQVMLFTDIGLVVNSREVETPGRGFSFLRGRHKINNK